MTGNIHSIETFGTVDGPGVRFVVFFEGCPMRCLYCHNPDTWVPGAGTQYTASALLARMLRNRAFYGTGGITATGGEPLMQLDFLIALFEEAKKNGIHTCLDTSGVMFHAGNGENLKKFDRLLAATDLVMLDIKHIDEDKHRALTGHGNANILAFARYLSEKNVPTRVRYVLVPGYTDEKDDLLRLGTFLGELCSIEKIEVLPYHTLGKAKYENLGIPYPLGNTHEATQGDAKAALEIIKSAM